MEFTSFTSAKEAGVNKVSRCRAARISESKKHKGYSEAGVKRPKRGLVTEWRTVPQSWWSFSRYVTETWLPNHQIGANTREVYDGVIRKRLVPYFGDMAIDSIIPSDVRFFIASQRRLGATPQTIQKCRTILGGIFTTALSDRLITLHPCTGVRIPVVPVLPLRVILPIEFSRLLDSVEGEQWSLLVELEIETGLRWGELTELRAGDFETYSRCLTVSRSCVEVSPRFHPTHGRFLVKNYTKNAKFRILKLRHRVSARLTNHVRKLGLESNGLIFQMPQQKALPPQPRAAVGSGVTKPNSAGRCYQHGTLTGYSMGRCRCSQCRAAYAHYRAMRRYAGKDRPPVGRPIDTDGHIPRQWFQRTVWKPALKRSGVERPIGFHGLRHAHGSWMLAGGATLQQVRERLGHSSLRSTERYVHTLVDTDESALGAFGRIRDRKSSRVAVTCHPKRRPSGQRRNVLIGGTRRQRQRA
ncbi:tyrosine-type recombinase/integrase [Crossiella sp. SN42]|uniref:tyrosine-type recombinase/integrase n=1 Tax=Crossiella sp. SN42 TaxID=2944808 RepID=UPI0035ABC6B6